MTAHILHLITGLGTGGAEHMLEKLVTGMDRTAFRNTVVALTGDDRIAPRLRAAGIAVHILDMAHPAELPRALLQLRHLLRRLQPDILQTWLYHADLLGSLAHLLTPSHATLLWNLRCSDMDMSQYSASARMVLRILPLLSRRPRHILSNSEAGRQHHIHLGYRHDGWIILPNGFDLATFRPDAAAGRQLRSELGLTDGARIVGMIARHDPMKDHVTFLTMAQRIAGRRDDVHFLLAGRGCEPGQAWSAAAQAALGSRLHLLGERRDVARLLPGLDVMALTSAYGEGFPNVLGEALACGTPSVATDVGDAARILGGCGTIVPPRDAEAMVAAVLNILELPTDRRAVWQQQMRDRAEREFSLPVIIARYEALYRELYTGGSSRAGV